MGKIWMPGNGQESNLDVITVNDPGDVMIGKVIVNKDGDPLIGTLALNGNASDNHVLTGRTYYNTDPKTKQAGSMQNWGAVNEALKINGKYKIPEGYHNGLGEITQDIKTMAGQTIIPKATQQIINCEGKYMTGNITINGVRTYANITQTVTSSTNMRVFYGLNNGDVNVSAYYVTINNLGFTPLYVSLVGEYKSGTPLHVGMDCWGIAYCLRNYDKYGNNLFYLKTENVSSSTIILPAGDYSGGRSFVIQAFGYY